MSYHGAPYAHEKVKTNTDSSPPPLPPTTSIELIRLNIPKYLRMHTPNSLSKDIAKLFFSISLFFMNLSPDFAFTLKMGFVFAISDISGMTFVVLVMRYCEPTISLDVITCYSFILFISLFMYLFSAVRKSLLMCPLFLCSSS